MSNASPQTTDRPSRVLKVFALFAMALTAIFAWMDSGLPLAAAVLAACNLCFHAGGSGDD